MKCKTCCWLLIGCLLLPLQLLADNHSRQLRLLLEASEQNPVDATWLITNPSFETGDLTGWTMTPSEGSDMGAREAEKTVTDRDYPLSGHDGNWIANLYTWWSGVAIEQVVGQVPAGIYEVSALVATWEGYTVNFYANGHMVSAAGQGDCTGIRLATTVTVGSDGLLTIRADRTDINWWSEGRGDIESTRLGFLKLDDVRLTCKGLLDVSRQSNFTATALNVDGLPQKVAFVTINEDGPGSEGTKLISKYLKGKDYDFIGVSEDFNYHGSLMSELDADYACGTLRATLDISHLSIPFDTDGLNLIWKKSKLQATNESWTRWDSTTPTDGNQYVKKGFRHYDMTLEDGQVIDVYVLHMDAGDVPESRNKQWQQLADAVNAADANRPKLIIGDTNSRWTREEIMTNFTNRLVAMTAKDAWVEMRREGVCPTTAMNDLADQTFPASTGTYEVVDKILYLNPTAGDTPRLVPFSFTLEQDYTYGTANGTEDSKPLGDHRPLVVGFNCMEAKPLQFLLGDVNRDGTVTIADVTALVNIILGSNDQPSSPTSHQPSAILNNPLVRADINADGGVTIADVTALVNIILGKGEWRVESGEGREEMMHHNVGADSRVCPPVLKMLTNHQKAGRHGGAAPTAGSPD